MSRRPRRLSRWRFTWRASLSATRSTECSRSLEDSRARRVTPFRWRVASATLSSAIAGFFSTSSSTSSWASSDTCLPMRVVKRSSTCRRSVVGDGGVSSSHCRSSLALTSGSSEFGCADAAPHATPPPGSAPGEPRHGRYGRSRRPSPGRCRPPSAPPRMHRALSRSCRRRRPARRGVPAAEVLTAPRSRLAHSRGGRAAPGRPAGGAPGLRASACRTGLPVTRPRASASSARLVVAVAPDPFRVCGCGDQRALEHAGRARAPEMAAAI